MKIGVVTYWHGSSNYGMIMQCWALQHKLKEMGHEPYVIRFDPERPKYILFAKKVIDRFRRVVSKSYRLEARSNDERDLYNAEKDKLRAFDVFREKHLQFSDCYYRYANELIKNPPLANCYVAGSDQIWCMDLSIDGNAKGMFLAFGDNNIRRVAYAPSFGRTTYNRENEHYLKEALSRFNSISCREMGGVELCQRLGFKAQKVVDPTMLLPDSDYEPLCESVAYKDYVFIYSVNMSSAEDMYWSAFKEMICGKKVVATPASGSIAGGELFGEEVVYDYATPGRWLSLIKNSDLVVTSSFHGIVFSIIFNKKFAFVPIKGTFSATNNRIFDLLDSLDLTDQIVSMPDDYMRVVNKDVDWDKVNKLRSQLVSGSLVFLDDALSL